MTCHLNPNIIFDSVYLRIRSDTPKTFDLTKLLNAVANKHIVGDGLCLIDTGTGDVFERNTKKFIVGRARKYILGLSERLCNEENMAEYVSLTQLNKLIGALSKKKKKEISCYSFVYIYIIYRLLDEDAPEVDECIEIMELLYEEILCFYVANPDNQLAAFLLGCYWAIIQALRDRNQNLAATELPAVPRKHVDDDQE